VASVLYAVCEKMVGVMSEKTKVRGIWMDMVWWTYRERRWSTDD